MLSVRRTELFLLFSAAMNQNSFYVHVILLDCTKVIENAIVIQLAQLQMHTSCLRCTLLFRTRHCL